MTTAYNRIDRILREKLSDDDYSTYKEELEAICQAKIQRTWVDLTPQDYAEIFRTARSVDYAARLAATKLKEKNT
jgi:hypothetical protein